VSPAAGINATLKTDAAGGYAVSASLAGTVVYWNIVLEVCDSPAVGFNTLLPKFNAPATQKAKSISGVNAFRVCLAAYSDDANYCYVVFGQSDWSADYSGNVDWSTGSAKWVKDSARVTGDGSITKIDHGKEAKAAGCEVRLPVCLDYIIDAR